MKKNAGKPGKVTKAAPRWEDKNLAINTKKYIGETRKKGKK